MNRNIITSIFISNYIYSCKNDFFFTASEGKLSNIPAAFRGLLFIEESLVTVYTLTPSECEKPLAKRGDSDSSVDMIRAGFLPPAERDELIELARDGSVAHRLARRANALVLLDQGMSCEAVAKVLFMDDDTIRGWHRLYEEDGLDGLASFG